MSAPTDALSAFAAYEAVRHRLPGASFPAQARAVTSLADLAEDHDAFLLDAFGVLNVGARPIPGAPERVAALQAMGKRVLVVTNAAGYAKRLAVERYAQLGYRFAPQDVVSSRDALLEAVAARPPRAWGLMAAERYGREGIEHLDTTFLADDAGAYDRAEGFLLLGAATWSKPRQALLRDSLRRQPRPLLVGNPDIVAPYEDGLSLEPGHFAHRLADEIGVVPEFFGKPFGNIYAIALRRLAGVDPRRVVMVGDTLQTDILGGRAAGLHTALVTGFGALAGTDPDAAIRRSGIVPDYILRAP